MADRREDSAFPAHPAPRDALPLQRRDSTAPGGAGRGGAARRYLGAARGGRTALCVAVRLFVRSP